MRLFADELIALQIFDITKGTLPTDFSCSFSANKIKGFDLKPSF